MARHPGIWADHSKGTYRTTIDGRRYTLGTIRAGKRLALKRFGELLERRESYGAGPAPTVIAVVVEYLEQLAARRDRGEVESGSHRDAVRRLADFPEVFARTLADRIRPDDVQQWLDRHPAWGPTTRHDAIATVKAAFRRAVRAGRLDRDPLADLDTPRRRARREEIPTPEAIARVLSAIASPELMDLLTFVYETGCRPKEARVLEARHLDLERGIAVQAAHKTARKTGRRRVIYLTPRALEIANRLAGQYPEGPLFRNRRGRPWTHNAVGLAVRRLRERAGLGREMVAYALRHAFATDALAGEAPAALVAELLGHADLRMIATYSHVSERHDALRAVVERMRDGGL